MLCRWLCGTQAFFNSIPRVIITEAGRVNGLPNYLDDSYDGYAECVKVQFNPKDITINDLMSYLFEIIDPYSLNQQGQDKGKKYRTGLYNDNVKHLEEA